MGGGDGWGFGVEGGGGRDGWGFGVEGGGRGVVGAWV